MNVREIDEGSVDFDEKSIEIETKLIGILKILVK